MLIIEIALGIVLAWFIINHFEVISSVVFFPFKIFFQVISFPFRFLSPVFREAWLIVYEMVFGFLNACKKGIVISVPYIVGITLVAGIIAGMFYIMYRFVPGPYGTYGLCILVGSLIAYGLFDFAKQAYLSYREKSSKLWILALVFLITIALSVLRAIVISW